MNAHVHSVPSASAQKLLPKKTILKVSKEVFYAPSSPPLAKTTVSGRLARSQTFLESLKDRGRTRFKTKFPSPLNPYKLALMER
jgi:hypothetical protein